MAERDPKTDPQFGDVFDMSGDAIMYLGPSEDGWWYGVDLTLTYDPPVQTWVRLSLPDWRFIEHIDATPTGGFFTKEMLWEALRGAPEISISYDHVKGIVGKDYGS